MSENTGERTQRTEELRALAAGLGLVFRDFELLDRALTHASVSAETDQPGYDYESLEFLGDAALGLAVAHYLFRQVPDSAPGEYSRMRAAVVNRRCLARVAGELGLGPHIRLGRGEELSGGRGRKALLADCLEALIGAFYLDQGWDAAHDFVCRVFAEDMRRAQESDRVWDYKSRLQHYCQAARIGLPVFHIVRSEGPDHRKEFEVEVWLNGEPSGCGKGLSKKEAEQRAAREALIASGILARREQRGTGG